MPKYAVIYWKSLEKNNITIKQFDDEQEMVEFVESKRMGGYAILIGEENYLNTKGEKTYKIRPTAAAYHFFKRIYAYVGIFLVIIIFLIILLWKYDLS